MASIASRPGVAIATQMASKALLDESHPANLGVYAGKQSDSDATRDRVDTAPTLILAGVVMSDFLTGFFTHEFDPAAAIELGIDEARVGDDIFYDVHLQDSLRLVDEILAMRGERAALPPATPPVPEVLALDRRVPVTHEELWPTLSAWLRPGTTVVAEAGTAFYGAVGMNLPDDCELLGQPVWSSIGYTLPATLGAMLAAPGRDTVLVIGDGSAQLTISELGTILARGLAPTILLIDNAGYTVERLIRSPDAVYQDITAWDWTALPAALGAPDTFVAKASTLVDLDLALAAARAQDGAALIHVTIDRDDAPPLLARIASGLN
ncbi:thiamine pyrophosphate-dependent enzyme [Paraoerskovia sediminicola]|nr:thiamine pyrophosphate-dependent enzyme [Paraoerskovia sediminicola]